MKTRYLSLAATAAMLAIPGQAAAKSGDVQLKLLATYVAPDGKIKDVKLDLIGLPASTQTKADDNVVPTIAIEYFVTDNISVETIAGVTQHDVVGRGGLAGAGLVSNANIVPATLTLKYHFGKDGGVQPYVGAGPSYFIFIDEKPGATAVALGATRQKMGDSLGMALQAGIDVPVNAKGSRSRSTPNAISCDPPRAGLPGRPRFCAPGTSSIPGSSARASPSAFETS